MVLVAGRVLATEPVAALAMGLLALHTLKRHDYLYYYCS